MAYRQEETIVSRSALRDAIRDDLLVALKSREVQADPSFDGAPVLTIPSVNEALDEVFSVALPPTSEKHGEVSTPATVTVHAACPECGISARTIVYLEARLVVDSTGAELNVKATSKAKAHVHGQAELPEVADGQVTVDDLLSGTETVEEPEPETTSERCPYPGCARDADHRGLHRDADGKKLTELDIEPKEGTDQ